MTMTRMFHISCDNCDADLGDEWYAESAVQVAKDAGFHLRNYTAICPDCWDGGTRFADLSK